MVAGWLNCTGDQANTLSSDCYSSSVWDHLSHLVRYLLGSKLGNMVLKLHSCHISEKMWPWSVGLAEYAQMWHWAAGCTSPLSETAGAQGMEPPSLKRLMSPPALEAFRGSSAMFWEEEESDLNFSVGKCLGCVMMVTGRNTEIKYLAEKTGETVLKSVELQRGREEGQRKIHWVMKHKVRATKLAISPNILLHTLMTQILE